MKHLVAVLVLPTIIQVLGIKELYARTFIKEIREENSKLIMKRLDKKRGKEKKDRKMGIMKKTDSPGPYPFFYIDLGY